MKENFKTVGLSRFIILLVSVLVLTGTLSFNSQKLHACEGKKCYRHSEKHLTKKAEHFAKKLIKKLDLNKEQASLVHKFKREFIAKKKSFKKHNKDRHKKLIAEIRKEKMDVQFLNNAQIKKHNNHKEMAKFMIARLVKLHSVLTPAQREKLANFIENVHQHKKGHHKRDKNEYFGHLKKGQNNNHIKHPNTHNDSHKRRHHHSASIYRGHARHR